MYSSKILGLISGSSLDGLDLAICQFLGDHPSNIEWTLLKSATLPLDSALIDELIESPYMSAKELMKCEILFSKTCARLIKQFIKDIDFNIDYISSHGHTIFHYPKDGITYQIGKGAVISELTRIPCITDFRSNDVALGGQGAPLAPIVEKWLYPGYEFYVNLGGIANISSHQNNNILSIDSVPCNQVLNFLSNQKGMLYDDKGLLARKGNISQILMSELSNVDYFSAKIPKSMDNSWVKELFIPILNNYDLSIEDKLATMTEFIAAQLASDAVLLNSETLTIQQSLLITGGGAFNDFLIDRIKTHFEKLNINVEIPNAETINFKEAILMALMGFLRINHLPNTISTVTGAKKATVGGAIYWANST